MYLINCLVIASGWIHETLNMKNMLNKLASLSHGTVAQAVERPSKV